MFIQRVMTICAALLLSCAFPVFAAYACNCTNTTTATEAPVAIDYTSLTLSEVYPNPRDDEEEFIELYNSGDTALDLSSLTLRDAALHSFTFDSGTMLAAGAYLTLAESTTHISLNNSGDTIELINSTGTTLCSTTYEKGDEGMSWAVQHSGQWGWGAPTQGSAPVEASDTDPKTTTEAGATTTTEVEQKESIDAGNLSLPGTTSTTIILSELLPNPETADTSGEWIEIQNNGAESIELRGWQISDTVTTFTIPDTTLAPEEFALYTLEETKITLNNLGDTVYLIDGLGTIIQGTTFEHAPAGKSWSLTEGAWAWSTPTPLDDNLIAVVEDPSEETPTTRSQTDSALRTEATIETLSIQELRGREIGTEATITGTITVEPGIFGDQYFYIQDATGGMQIYAYNKQFPDLAIGDIVRVTGTLSNNRGEARLKISSAQDCVVTAHGSTIQAVETEILTEEHEGALATLRGTVTSRTSAKILLDDGSLISIKPPTQITASLYDIGAVLAITGVVGQYDDEYRLMPRGAEDIEIELEELSSSFIPTAQAASTQYTLTSSERTDFPWSILVLGIVLTLGGVGVYIKLIPQLRALIQRRLAHRPLPTVESIAWPPEDEE